VDLRKYGGFPDRSLCRNHARLETFNVLYSIVAKGVMTLRTRDITFNIDSYLYLGNSSKVTRL
jgi:hypothetical protein